MHIYIYIYIYLYIMLVINYSQTSIKRPSIKRTPCIKRTVPKVPNWIHINRTNHHQHQRDLFFITKRKIAFDTVAFSLSLSLWRKSAELILSFQALTYHSGECWCRFPMVSKERRAVSICRPNGFWKFIRVGILFYILASKTRTIAMTFVT